MKHCLLKLNNIAGIKIYKRIKVFRLLQQPSLYLVTYLLRIVCNTRIVSVYFTYFYCLRIEVLHFSFDHKKVYFVASLESKLWIKIVFCFASGNRFGF